MKGIYQKVSLILEEGVKKEFGLELEPPLWELPQHQEFGDLSSMAALKIASRLKKGPLEIAPILQSFLEKLVPKEIAKIDIVRPGFLNLYISKDSLFSSLNELLRDRDDFFREKIKDKILLEFVSANPTGPLSIAHGRQAVVGDTIANLLDFFGNKI